MSLVPVTIVTGLPCSGKTSLIRQLIQHQNGERIVWIAMSFESTVTPTDVDLRVLSGEEQVVDIDNGELRCQVRGDLLRAVRTLQTQRAQGVLQFDRVIIETSGLAEPAPVVQTFFADEAICDQYRLDAVITVLNAEQAMEQLDAHHEAQDQVGFADRIVLTRNDTITAGASRALHGRLKRMNPRARLLSSDSHLVMAQQLLDIRDHYLLDAVITMVDAKHAMAQFDTHHEAQEQVGFADRILLTKTDLVSVDDVRSLEQRVKRMNPRAPVTAAHFGDTPIDQLLDVRGFNLNAILQIEPDFLTDADHEHDDDVTSFVFRAEQAFDAERLEDFLTDLLQGHGASLMRYKGVIDVAHHDRRVVLQGVHMLMGMDDGTAWAHEEQRHSRIVFIGKNMPKQLILQGLARCLVPAHTDAAKAQKAT
jgi:G3E family GTPase